MNRTTFVLSLGLLLSSALTISAMAQGTQAAITEQEAQDYPGGGRSQDHRANDRRMKVSHNFFQGKQYCCKRRIESRSNRRCCADG